MNLWTRSVLSATVAALATFGVASAQTEVPVYPAELAVPFGAVNGHVAVVGDQLLFVDTETPATSFAIPRMDIVTFDRSGDVVTIATRKPLRYQADERTTFRFRVASADGLASWYDRAPMTAATREPAAQDRSTEQVTFQVKHDHRLGSCQGRLIIMDDRIAFESVDKIDDSRQWVFADIKEVSQDGIYRLKVVPFLDSTFNFELVGKGMDSQQFRRLVDRIAQARATH